MWASSNKGVLISPQMVRQLPFASLLRTMVEQGKHKSMSSVVQESNCSEKGVIC